MCSFFSALVQRQFPRKCIYDVDHMRAKYPHNIGWSHTVHDVQNALKDTMRPGQTHKVLVVPRADPFDGQHQDFRLSNGTMYHRDRSRWYWASHTCPEETVLFDPWACNFLSVTNCSTRESVLMFPDNHEKGAFGDHFAFTNALGITDQSRARSGDGPLMDMQSWINTRILVYLQRGNARMRQMIRRSFRNIVRLSSHGAVSASSHRSHDSKLPCVALHVRHGDAVKQEKQRSGDKSTDRSFEGHVREVKRALKALGTNVVFLMTDNSTLHRVAPSQYPEIVWLMQRRPIKEHKVMYRVNNEDDIQLELAHLQADVRMAGSCVAVVACFDSGVSIQSLDTAYQQSFDGGGLRGYEITVQGNLSPPKM